MPKNIYTDFLMNRCVAMCGCYIN